MSTQQPLLCQVSAASAHAVAGNQQPPPQSELDAADRIRDLLTRHFDNVPIVHAEGSFWAWAGTHWCRLPVEFIRAVALRAFEPPISHGKANTIIAILATTRRHEGFFDDVPVGIPAANLFVSFDTRTGAYNAVKHHPDYRNRYVLRGRVYNGTPKRELLDALLNGSFQDDPEKNAKIIALAELCGVVALGIATRMKQPRAFILLGNVIDVEATTMTGKSQILTMLRGLLPEDVVSSVSLAQLGGDFGRYVPRLVGKYLLASAEMPSAAVFASETFKAVVTGDAIAGREAKEKAVEFRPKAQIVNAGNQLPDLGRLDAAARRRLAIIHFLRRVPDDEQIPDLGQRIVDEEPDALLHMAIGGARRVIQNGLVFDLPPSSDELIKQWSQATDLVADLFTRVIRREEGGFLVSPPLYGMARKWWEDQGYDLRNGIIPKKRAFHRLLEGHFNVAPGRDKKGALYGYRDLTWKETAD